MKLLRNANKIAEEKLKLDNVIAAYKSVVTAMNNNYRHPFATSLQIYITKLGLILSECSQDVKMSVNTYLGSIDYICLKLLNNRALYNIMRNIEINNTGNSVKHSLEDIEIDIDLTLTQYNQFVSEIIKATQLIAFKRCYLNKGKNLRDVPIAEDAKHHKYFTVNNIQFQLKISPDYTVDQYTKKLRSKITLYWPKGREGFFVGVTVSNDKSTRIMARMDKLAVSGDNSKHAFELICGETDLDRRVLYLTVQIELYQKKNSGSFVLIERKTEKISQLFRVR